MIYAPLKHVDRYKALSPRIAAALEFLQTADFSALADGRVDLDGENLFVNIMTYDTKPSNHTPEHHEHYADIQCVLSGREIISVLPMDEVGAPLSSEGDCYLFEGEGQPVEVKAGEFMILFPEDAHAPGVSPSGQPERVRKAVAKVCLD